MRLATRVAVGGFSFHVAPLSLARLPIWGVSLFIPAERAAPTMDSIDVSGKVAMVTLKSQMLSLPSQSKSLNPINEHEMESFICLKPTVF